MLNRMEMTRIFLAAADAATFREAAHQLGTSPQKVTRAIQEFERVLGEPLFHRSTRQTHITAFGTEVARQARDALESFDQLFIANGRQRADTVAGRVGVTAPRAIGRRYLAGYVATLMRLHPGLSIELCLDDELTDAVASRIDIGIRIGTVRDRRYIARTAGGVPVRVVAAPSLVEAVGVPTDLDELKRLPLSTLIDRNSGRPWPWMFRGETNFIPATPTLTCDDAETELEMTLAGMVFAQVPHYLAAPYLASGQLVEVLAEQAPPPFELIVYRTQSGPVPRRVRVVFDHLLASFSAPEFFPFEQ